MKEIEGQLHREGLLNDHFRLFAAMISGAAQSEFETGELPQRGRQIFPAQCWKDVVCAKIVAEVLRTHEVMVVGGSGHIDFGLGIPCRARALLEKNPIGEAVREVIITCRARGEPVTLTFRGHRLCDVLITYEPTWEKGRRVRRVGWLAGAKICHTPHHLK